MLLLDGVFYKYQLDQVFRKYCPRLLCLFIFPSICSSIIGSSGWHFQYLLSVNGLSLSVAVRFCLEYFGMVFLVLIHVYVLCILSVLTLLWLKIISLFYSNMFENFSSDTNMVTPSLLLSIFFQYTFSVILP